MKIITHRSKEALYNVANELNKEVFESNISFSFRTYDEKGNTKEFHQFLKH